MFMKVENMQFESKSDFVDYVCGGFLPPSKRDFNFVIDKIMNPDNLDNPVVMFKDIFTEEEKPLFVYLLQRMYTNRVKNRNILAGIGGAFLAVYFCFMKKK